MQNLTFEQLIAVLSLVVAVMTLFFSIVLKFIEHHANMKRMLKEKQVDCYCQLIFILIKILKEGLNENYRDEFVKYSSAAMILGSKDVIQEVNY